MVVVGAGAVGRGDHAAGVVAVGVKLERLAQELAGFGDNAGRRVVGGKGQLVVDEVSGAAHERERAVAVGLRQAVAALAVAAAKVGRGAGRAKRVAIVERAREAHPQALEVLYVRVESHAPPLPRRPRAGLRVFTLW